jgi:CRP-like cAMP-binding protein
MGNLLLASLTADVQRRLTDIGSLVPLDKSAVLVTAGTSQTHVYFPFNGLLSLRTVTPGGRSVEVAMLGREGVAALPLTGRAAAGYTMVVTVSGMALRLSADALQAEFDRNPSFQRAMIRHWTRLMGEIANGSACHLFHTPRQRLAHWLLAASVRTQSSRIELTQEQLGAILGMPRTCVTIASVTLQNAGAITARYGRIRIVDRARLRNKSCECRSDA